MPAERRQGDRFTRPARPGEPERAGEPRSGNEPLFGLLRRWPPVLWLLIYVGSIFILNGSNGKWDPLELALGIGLAAIACALAVYLAIGPWPGRPRPRGTALLISGVAAFYGVCTLAAAIFAGPAEAIATLLAGIIPMTGAALWVATTRAKTVPEIARERDPAADDRNDPFPGVGADEVRPLGDTPEAHDEITPHDLPPGHPARHAAERQAHDLGGTTPGHREGGATDTSSAEPDIVSAEEQRDGARVNRRAERRDA
jgi:hypothetical protein